MDEELDLLLGTAINSLAKLEILLYLHQRPGAVTTSEKLAPVLRRPEEEIAAALEELSSLGLVDRFRVGTGRRVMYGTPEDEQSRRMLALLHEHYHRDPETRSALVRRILGQGEQTDGEHP